MAQTSPALWPCWTKLDPQARKACHNRPPFYFMTKVAIPVGGVIHIESPYDRQILKLTFPQGCPPTQWISCPVDSGSRAPSTDTAEHRALFMEGRRRVSVSPRPFPPVETAMWVGGWLGLCWLTRVLPSRTRQALQYALFQRRQWRQWRLRHQQQQQRPQPRPQPLPQPIPQPQPQPQPPSAEQLEAASAKAAAEHEALTMRWEWFPGFDAGGRFNAEHFQELEALGLEKKRVKSWCDNRRRARKRLHDRRWLPGCITRFYASTSRAVEPRLVHTYYARSSRTKKRPAMGPSMDPRQAKTRALCDAASSSSPPPDPGQSDTTEGRVGGAHPPAVSAFSKWGSAGVAPTTLKRYAVRVAEIIGEGHKLMDLPVGVRLRDVCDGVRRSTLNRRMGGEPHAALQKYLKFLHVAPSKATGTQVNLHARVDDEEVQGLYVIEKLCSLRRCCQSKDQIEFLVKWEGYPDSVNTWEPEKEILRATPGLVKQLAQQAQGRDRSSYDAQTRTILAARGWACLQVPAESEPEEGQEEEEEHARQAQEEERQRRLFSEAEARCDAALAQLDEQQTPESSKFRGVFFAGTTKPGWEARMPIQYCGEYKSNKGITKNGILIEQFGPGIAGEIAAAQCYARYAPACQLDGRHPTPRDGSSLSLASLVHRGIPCYRGCQSIGDKVLPVQAESQYPGVSWDRSKMRWKAEIQRAPGSRPRSLGFFDMESEADQAIKSRKSRATTSNRSTALSAADNVSSKSTDKNRDVLLDLKPKQTVGVVECRSLIVQYLKENHRPQGYSKSELRLALPQCARYVRSMRASTIGEGTPIVRSLTLRANDNCYCYRYAFSYKDVEVEVAETVLSIIDHVECLPGGKFHEWHRFHSGSKALAPVCVAPTQSRAESLAQIILYLKQNDRTQGYSISELRPVVPGMISGPFDTRSRIISDDTPVLRTRDHSSYRYRYAFTYDGVEPDVAEAVLSMVSCIECLAVGVQYEWHRISEHGQHNLKDLTRYGEQVLGARTDSDAVSTGVRGTNLRSASARRSCRRSSAPQIDTDSDGKTQCGTKGRANDAAACPGCAGKHKAHTCGKGRANVAAACPFAKDFTAQLVEYLKQNDRPQGYSVAELRPVLPGWESHVVRQNLIGSDTPVLRTRDHSSYRYRYAFTYDAYDGVEPDVAEVVLSMVSCTECLAVGVQYEWQWFYAGVQRNSSMSYIQLALPSLVDKKFAMSEESSSDEEETDEEQDEGTDSTSNMAIHTPTSEWVDQITAIMSRHRSKAKQKQMLSDLVQTIQSDATSNVRRQKQLRRMCRSNQLTGRRIAVYWQDDSSWYNGSVVRCDTGALFGKGLAVEVLYDDGELHVENISDASIKLLAPKAPFAGIGTEWMGLKACRKLANNVRVGEQFQAALPTFRCPSLVSMADHQDEKQRAGTVTPSRPILEGSVAGWCGSMMESRFVTAIEAHGKDFLQVRNTMNRLACVPAFGTVPRSVVEVVTVAHVATFYYGTWKSSPDGKKWKQRQRRGSMAYEPCKRISFDWTPPSRDEDGRLRLSKATFEQSDAAEVEPIEPESLMHLQLAGQTAKLSRKRTPSLEYQQKLPGATQCMKKRRKTAKRRGASAPPLLAYGSERERTSLFLSKDIERLMRYRTVQTTETEEPNLDGHLWYVMRIQIICCTTVGVGC
jgi:hypothetical protein